ncbi:hypothetical protein GCM10010371_67810 [Streptomyces subrutilus]|uniref:Uncharacterized protein n=1 Tax=Streptomyces subrutilus TaxID=36818 RepID=A0A918RI12_9ACTN|nr:hypothetical protein GCM10010371_67810 [Streptomyces subrutilus]
MVAQLQYAGRCGGGASKPERLQDGDGADDRTGWPEVIRGRRGRCRGAVPAAPGSEVQHLGEGVGCGRAHREVRQWGSKPEQTHDGRRGWLPERGAGTGRAVVRVTSSTQFPW